ncbi:MAG TPA: hypothetical protein VFN35_31750, partial [Ktedonobacteraceae bacterium]|nr:hypothetical protein [Ktedonobacteraceae bacterium]
MAKQEEQKPGTTARQDKPTASVPSRTSAIKTATQVPLTPVIRENDTFSPAEQKPLVERSIRRRQLLLGGLGAAVTLAGASAWIWSIIPHPEANQGGRTGGQGDQLVLQWNNATLQAIRELQPDVPVAARALAIVHTCMFDAWTAYDTVASSTRSGVRMKRPAEEHTQSNKAQAVSFAAYRALITL